MTPICKIEEGFSMSISGISSAGSLASVYQAPPVQQQQAAKASAQAPKADTVTISPQAQQLASDGDSKAKEVKESGAESASEKLRVIA
jgi:hypothetical protein